MDKRTDALARSIDGALVTDHDYRGLSIGRLIAYKARVLAKYGYMRVRSPVGVSARLAATRATRGSCTGRPALVVGMGPSLNALDSEAVAEAQKKGNLAVFGLNKYYLTRFGRRITPQYYVLADSWFFDDENWSRGGESGPSLAEYFHMHPATCLVLPADAETPPEAESRACLHFSHLGLESWSRNIDPTRARGFMSMTVMHALSMAIHLGYSPIYLVGADSDMFRKVARSPDGSLIVGDGFHAYPDPGGVAHDAFQGDAAAFLEDSARVIADFRRFSSADVRVLAQMSLLDAFPLDRETFQSPPKVGRDEDVQHSD